jgi:methyl-accepting chemotaxis protein
LPNSLQSAAAGTQDVSGNFAGVTEADRQTGYAASGVLNTIKELNQQSEVIRTVVAELLDNAIAA